MHLSVPAALHCLLQHCSTHTKERIGTINTLCKRVAQLSPRKGEHALFLSSPVTLSLTLQDPFDGAACLTLSSQHARVGRITYETRESAASPGVRRGNNRDYSIISADCTSLCSDGGVL